MNRAVLLFCLLISLQSTGQQLNQFNKERTQIDKQLMIGLGTWATSNFLVSGFGWATVPKSESYYFHQMNVLWNTVNIALAIPGYLKAKNDFRTLTLNETIKTQRKTQNIFLINTGLDVVYISSGFLLRNSAKSNFSSMDRFNGFGNALILQGGFLFIFDLSAYLIHRTHSKRLLNKSLNSFEMSSTGLGFKWNIQSKVFSEKKQFL